MHASSRIFDKICLKAIKIFFSNMWSVINEQVDSIFWWGWYSTEVKSSNVLACRETPPPKKFFFLAGHPDLPKGKTLRKVLDQLTVMILKRVSENISFQYIYSKFRDIKEVANSLIWHSIYWRLSIHFKIRSINNLNPQECLISY